jgi:menaquinone-specific isochorismate synthase
MTLTSSAPNSHTPDDNCLTLGEARDRLIDLVSSCDEPRAMNRVLRFEVEVSPIEALRWLAAQRAGQRFAFRSRDGRWSVAGVGCALRRSDWNDPALQQLLASHAASGSCGMCGPALYYRAFFDPGAVGKHAPEWSGFERTELLLPLVELRRVGTKVTLAANVAGDPRKTRIALEELEDPAAAPLLPQGLRIAGDADLSRWADAVDAALGSIAAGSLEKVVLARTRTYSALQHIDPCAVLAALQCEEPSAFHCMVEPRPGSAFVVASPERLFHREGLQVRTEAVAGTCARGPDGGGDDRLAGRLLGSDKNRREHEIVVRRIKSALAPLVVGVTQEESPTVMRLRHVQHLVTAVSAVLREGIGDEQLLRELHPTPAVCGLPIDASRAFIREHERMHRGLYSGVIGVVAGGLSEFAVSIRGALVHGSDITAYAGAGIVRGSDPDAEWLETERKLAPFDSLVARAAAQQQGARVVEPDQPRETSGAWSGRRMAAGQ